MLHLLKRHPFSVSAFFRQSLVLTYAFPSDLLRPLLPPGLALDTYGAYGFLAIAMVQAQRLRPSFLPAALGRDFFLSGYRIFARLANGAGSLRGLRILRSDTNHPWMVRAGNLLTHYQYRLCEAELNERPGELEWNIRTPRQEADLRVIAHIADEPSLLPAGSPFLNLKDARRFAGPLPYTFDYEPETHSIIRIQGVRREWHPKPIAVEVLQNTFLRQQPFRRATPILANAFRVHDVPYAWKRGIRTPLEST
jgi:Uncharacterized conserved protein (COG2071)